MMKNRKKLIGICILAIFLLLMCKLYILHKYKSEDIKIDTSLIFNETLTIPDKLENNSSDSINYQKLTISNYFQEYVESTSNPNLKVKYNDNNEVISFYSMSSSKQYIKLLNMKAFELTENNDSNIELDTDKNMKLLLEKNKINNDVDYLNYIKDNYYFKNNIITNIINIKNNYILNTFVQVTLPEFKNIILLNGHVNGYIIVMNNNIKEIHLLHDDEQYIITLSGDEIVNNEFIIKLLSTVKYN